MVMSDISLEPGEHKITFTVTIACAVQAVESDAPVFESKKGRRMAVYEAPKPQQYFHLEYKLMPDDLEPIKTDVVMYGVAAKIYTDNDSKVVRTWKEGEKIWIAWTQNVSVWVTKEFLLSAFEHSLDLIIWDSKEKVSTRARFDRPKAFRLPEGPENEEANTPSQNNGSSNVKALVLRQSISHVQLQLKESRQNKDRLAQTASGRTLKDFENAEEQRSTTAPSTVQQQNTDIQKVKREQKQSPHLDRCSSKTSATHFE